MHIPKLEEEILNLPWPVIPKSFHRSYIYIYSVAKLANFSCGCCRQAGNERHVGLQGSIVYIGGRTPCA
jgi:hypothetical protein